MVREIGSRRELFVDDWLIEQMQGVSLALHSPTPREVALAFDAPWEGRWSAYVTVMRDGDRFRMYYRGNPDEQTEVTCLAESTDGVAWTRPYLQLFAFGGSKANNIVWVGERALRPTTHNFTPFLDRNPDAPASERYKALAGAPLIAFGSPDGVRWKPLREEPVITKGAFDSQNLGFWDTERRCYVAFVRDFRDEVRDVRTCTSTDFRHWTEPEFLDYGDAPSEQFYTNAIVPYFRAPHLYLGFPKRFAPDRKVVPETSRMGVSDTVFMSSRDGLHWDRRFQEAFIRPGLDPLNWMHRSNMTAWGLLPTGPGELSLYTSERYDTPSSRLRRATVRTDGFASARALASGGELLTKPLTFRGRELVINFSTSAAGGVQVELQGENASPFSGFALNDCPVIYGDAIEQVVAWNGGADVSRLAGQPLRLRFVMYDADLYSLRFRP